jgi:hypothetical protein
MSDQQSSRSEPSCMITHENWGYRSDVCKVDGAGENTSGDALGLSSEMPRFCFGFTNIVETPVSKRVTLEYFSRSLTKIGAIGWAYAKWMLQGKIPQETLWVYLPKCHVEIICSGFTNIVECPVSSRAARSLRT